MPPKNPIITKSIPSEQFKSNLSEQSQHVFKMFLRGDFLESKRDYSIITDITCDLSAEELDSMGISAIPLHVIIDDVDYTHYADYRNLPISDFLEKLKDCKSIRTSQIDTEIAESTMRSVLEKGKDILYIAFSSSLSGTYCTSKILADELSAEFPEAKIRVVDSLSASGGLGMLVCLAAQKKVEGMGIDELVSWLEEKRHLIGHWFTVDDLQHLRKGGRISGTASFVGGLLKVKPILIMDDSGKLVPHSKVSGRKKSFDALVNKMHEHGKGNKFDTVFISHSGVENDALCLKEKIEEEFEVKKFVIVNIDPIIAAHTGHGCLAVFFEATER